MNQGSAKAGIREGWTPSAEDIAELERVLGARTFVGAEFQSRVRVYAGVIEDGRKVILGLLLTPYSAGGRYKPAPYDQATPQTWRTGHYVVPIERLPWRIDAQAGIDCDYIQMAFDPQSKQLNSNSCIH